MTTRGFDKHEPREPGPIQGLGMGVRPPTPAEEAKHARDFPFPAVAGPPPVSLPPSWSLPTWTNQNQNGRGACASFAMGRVALCERGRIWGADTVFDPSEEALYVQGLQDTDVPCVDAGLWPGTLADIITKKGIVGEWYLPYMSTDLCGPLSDDIRMAMTAERAMYYTICPDDYQLKQAIASGHRVCACFYLEDSFNHLIRCADGSLEMPQPSGGIVGGHAMDFYGYDDGRVTQMGIGAYRMQNQWGYDTPIWVPYQLCHLPAWQQNGPGLWYDATYTFSGWNGQSEPEAAPAPAGMTGGEVKQAVLTLLTDVRMEIEGYHV